MSGSASFKSKNKMDPIWVSVKCEISPEGKTSFEGKISFVLSVKCMLSGSSLLLLYIFPTQ